MNAFCCTRFLHRLGRLDGQSSHRLVYISELEPHVYIKKRNDSFLYIWRAKESRKQKVESTSLIDSGSSPLPLSAFPKRPSLLLQPFPMAASLSPIPFSQSKSSVFPSETPAIPLGISRISTRSSKQKKKKKKKSRFGFKSSDLLSNSV